MLDGTITASRAAWALVLVIAVAAPKFAEAAADTQGETVVQTICRQVENAAAQHSIPVPFLTRLIWQESTFRADVTSRAGAQGVAQFMPGTARERGLADPFDPEQAIPAAAFLLSDLRRTFGNLGLAAAAYNGGPGRVSTWLAGRGGLPDETRDYVARITGRSADDWSSERKGGPSSTPSTQPEQACLQITAELRRGTAVGVSLIAEGARAPWGVQLAGNFSKAVALASFNRTRAQIAEVLRDEQPMVLGSRLRSRGRQVFYRVRVPAQTRNEANALCTRIRSAGGACAVLRT